MLCLQQKLTYVPVFAHPCGRSVPSKRRTEKLNTPNAQTERIIESLRTTSYVSNVAIFAHGNLPISTRIPTLA